MVTFVSFITLIFLIVIACAAVAYATKDKSQASVILGVLIASAVVTAACFGVVKFWSYVLG